MEDFKEEVRRWRLSLGLRAPDEQTLQSLCQPRIRPIIEDMMKRIRPVAEVQMIKRTLAMRKLKMNSDSEATNSKDEKLVELERKHEVLRKEVEKKRAQQSAQKKRIESLKMEVEQKHREAKKMERDIGELKKLTLMATSVSQNLQKNSQQQTDRVAQELQSSPSEKSTVGKFAAQQEVVITDLETCIVSPPSASAACEPAADMGWHLEHVKSIAENVALRQQLENYKCRLETAVESLVQCHMRSSPASGNEKMVREWARLQVTNKINDLLETSLKDALSSRTISVRCDRDYLRLLLLDAEKQLDTLYKKYKGAQEELMQEADDLSHSWQRIEEAAEKARRKRSQLQVACEEAQICLPELAKKLRLAASAELVALHDTMLSLTERDGSAQEVLGLGTTYNDLFYILNLVAQKRMAKYVIPSWPKMFVLSDDRLLKYIDSPITNRRCESESDEKVSTTICEYLRKSDRLIQSLKDLISIWWQPQFEEAVPEDLVVMEKNILQHTAHWDRVTALVENKK